MSDPALPGTHRDPVPSSLKHWLRLHLSFLYHPEASDALLERYGDARGIFKVAEEGEARLRGTLANEALRKKLVDPAWKERAEREITLCQRFGARILLRRDAGRWPGNLLDLPWMPVLLFCQGDWKEADRNAVAIVGSRRPSPYGVRQARRFAGALAGWGWTVVSGLARGIDGEAHRAALEAGGRTVGVLGSGLGRVYPRENQDLARAIVQGHKGLLLSEFPWASPPLKHHFPQRNRILSGLAQLVVVVEAGERSGSLITVDWALKQGRPVFAVPGRVDQSEARGCLRLIQDGAYPILDPEELAESVCLPVVPSDSSGRRLARDAELATPSHGKDPFLEKLLPLFADQDAWHPDALAERLGLEPRTLLTELARLEGRRKIRRILGGQFVLEEDGRLGT